MKMNTFLCKDEKAAIENVIMFANTYKVILCTQRSEIQKNSRKN